MTPERAPPAEAAESAADFDTVWEEVRGDGDIQFEPPPPEKPKAGEPQWWTDFKQWLSDLFPDISADLSGIWPFVEYTLIALLAAGIAILLWKLAVWALDTYGSREESPVEPEWVPEEKVARELLDEADALAARGEYDEAAHLLLYRSIEDIERKRPQLLRPSNTAREIGRFEALSEGARETFAIIAGHVERSLFAAHPLDAKAWDESREAYGRFAFKENWT